MIAIFLNSNAAYKAQHYRLTNAFMFLYVLFITWERTRHYKFSATAELVVNDAEHILFALLICFIFNFLLSLKKAQALSFTQKLLITIVSFNLVGVLNEGFQNLLGHRPLFVMIDDSKKDILMNVIGSVVFVLLLLVMHTGKKAITPSAKQVL